MKKLLILLLALLLLAVPVFAQSPLVNDGEGLLSNEEIAKLEQLYGEYSQDYGFAPILVTTDSFQGYDAATYAGRYYDTYGYPYDGILLLVSLSEGQWYILTNGACHDRISDWDAESIGGDVVSMIRNGDYYEAFAAFPELAAQYFSGSDVSIGIIGGADGPTAVFVTSERNYWKTIGISMAVGMVIGLIAVGIMAAKMKSVRQQSGAGDYIRPGSMNLTRSRDIFLYSHVHRTPKPKNNSSGGSHGGSRGGAGGRI